ncbi:hypothetical protein [Methanosarcina siciliae]|uniref:hypothetical protein n=1 Tax=Methanosarcina siciliae TaxID=38027 RepID=UPI00064E7E0B|nr:hypothetical protein [Methanosarcina siciliae]
MAALATEDIKSIAMTAEILMSEPEIGISVDTISIDFGSLYLDTSSGTMTGWATSSSDSGDNGDNE